MNFSFENFADFSNLNNNLNNDILLNPNPNTRKDDYLSNFWKDLPNLDKMDFDLEPIQKEIESFVENKDKISEIGYLFDLKNNLYNTINNLKKTIKEKNKDRDKIVEMCEKSQQKLIFFKNNDALLTTNPKDIEYNKVWKEDIQKFETKLRDYRYYVTSTIDTNVSKILHTIQKHQTMYDKIMDITNSINKSIFETHYKDKMPNSILYCTICLTNTSSHVCDPCGHIFCKSCCNKINNKCPICRKYVEKVIKMYNLDEIKTEEI
jgi:hypothetical protein